MKRMTALSCLGLIGISLFAGASRAGSPGPATRPAQNLIVHEWGTFTGFVGSDGVNLPFDIAVGADLPEFVMNRLKQGAPAQMKQMMFIKGGGVAALARMETPVIYFYADKAGEVDVRVDFPKGLLTEFYPPVQSMGPKYGRAAGEVRLERSNDPANLPTPTDPFPASYLDWGRIWITPHPAGNEGKLIPAVINKNHYAYARDTDSALVQFSDSDGKRHEEKFLFYRGLGNFTLPVTLLAKGADQFELQNATHSPIRSAFLMEVGDDRQLIRFTQIDNVNGNRTLALPPASAGQGDLSEVLTRALIADGLYEKEARAMVNTWKANWLAEPGTRLLYLVPRRVTDGMLALQIKPAAEQTVRVFVGRIDVLTPEREVALRDMMIKAEKTGTISAADARLMDSLGRFQTPAMMRGSKLAGDTDYHMNSAVYVARAHMASNQK